MIDLHRRRLVSAACAAAGAAWLPAAAHAADDALAAAIAGPWRSAANRARDGYRHPRETLDFFGFRADQTVVEIWPDTGWFAEILAPALRERGRYVAAQYPLDHPATNAARREARLAFDAMLRGNPAVYGKVVMSELAVPDKLAMVPPGTADLVLAFRSVHVWFMRSQEDIFFKAAADALKPGGVLGVEDHRAPADWPRERQVATGYVTEAGVIAAAQRAGLRLVGRSEVNANPRDAKDYAKGVWALPPTYAYGDADRAKYAAIGESDRMTLRFAKG
jgi:predicted methyltransferase